MKSASFMLQIRLGFFEVLITAPHFAEIFNAVFQYLCQVCTGGFRDQELSLHRKISINAVWTLMTHFSLRACSVIGQKMKTISSL